MAQLFVDNLTVMDFSFLDKDRGVVGESWIVDMQLTGELDDQGMVFDFGHVKKQIKQFIDNQADHRLLVPVKSPGCTTRVIGGALSVEFPLTSGAVISHQSPIDAVLLVDSYSIDTEAIARDLQFQLKNELPDNVQDVLITLRAENIEGFYYHYTHGLQKHLGQCQRIAHGHRSRIEIEINGERNLELEKQWAKRLADSYIATESHIDEQFELNDIEHIRLAYMAEQGEFSISLPRSQVVIMPDISTVENIATYIAESIAKEMPGNIMVKAFEGVEKGAIGKVGSI